MLNGFVRLVIRSFELTLGLVVRVGLVMEAAVGERSAKTFVEKQKQQGHLDAFVGEPIGVPAAITLQQSMAFELAQIIAELVQTIGVGGELKGGENGLVDLLGSPSAQWCPHAEGVPASG